LAPNNMGFVVLPALVTDISAVYDAYFAAFKDNAVTKALFPSATASDMTNPESEFRYALSIDCGVKANSPKKSAYVSYATVLVN
jgi:hypothetical protein